MYQSTAGKQMKQGANSSMPEEEVDMLDDFLFSFQKKKKKFH